MQLIEHIDTSGKYWLCAKAHADLFSNKKQQIREM